MLASDSVCKVIAVAAVSALAVSAFARETTGLSVDAENSTVTVVLGEAAAGGETNAVYYAWSVDGQDKGDDISNWPNVVRLGIVDETDAERTFSLAESPTAQYAARAFLATTSRGYDYLIEAVKSTGTAAGAATCYIDTGFYPVGNKTICIVDCKMDNTKGQQYLFGCNDSGSLSYCGYINGTKSSGGKWAFSCDNGAGEWKMPTDLTVSSTERVVVKLDGTPANETGYVTVKSTGATHSKSYSAAHTATSAYPLVLFGRNSAGTTNLQTLATVYSCIITNDGACVRDFHPAMKRGVAGLWDSVDDKFYASAGSDALIAIGTNETYFVEDGDVVASASPTWTQASSDYVTDELYVESLSLTFASGGTKRGKAPLVLTGENNWGGSFTVYEGSLIADFGRGLAATDAVILDGGSYGPITGEMVGWTPGASAAPGTVSVASGATSFGFTAYGHPLSVVANGQPGSTLEYGTASPYGFNQDSLILNDVGATDTLTLRHGIKGVNSDESVPSLAIYSGAAEAVVEGGITNLSLVKWGAGALRIHSATNTFGDLRPYEGSLVFAPPQGVATSFTAAATFTKGTNTASDVTFSNSVVRLGGSPAWRGGTDVTFVKSDVTASEGDMTIGSTAGVPSAPAKLVLDNSSMSLGSKISYLGSAACAGAIIITNGSSLTAYRLCGYNGTVNQYGGTVTLTGNVSDNAGSYPYNYSMGFGASSGKACIYNLYGGKLEMSNSSAGFAIGVINSASVGNGTLNVYDGEVTSKGAESFIARFRNDKGYLYVKGGKVTFSKANTTLYLTDAKAGAQAVCSVSDGGVLDINGLVNAGRLVSDATGRKSYFYVYTNGTVKARQIRCTADTTATATMVLDGGTIEAKPSANASFIYGFHDASVGIGGVVIDTNGQDVEAAQSFAARANQAWTFGNTPAEIVAAPAFTKAGEGVLTLTGTNSWLCGTCVSNGTLAVAEKALPETNLRLAGGVIDLCGLTHTVTNLIGSGTIVNGTLVVVGRVWPGYGDNDKLVVAADATLSATNLSYSVDSVSGTCGTLVVKSPFDLSGVTIDIDNQEATGRHGLVLVDGPVAGRPLSDPGVSVGANKVRFRAPGGMLLIH